MKYKKQILAVLEDMGILVEETDDVIVLHDYIQDSIQFITFIVKLEEKFDFVFPDELLEYESISTIEMVNHIIESIKQ